MGEKKQLVPLLLAIVLLCGVLYAVHPDGLMSWLPEYLEQLEQPLPDDPSDNPSDDPSDDPTDGPSTPVTPPNPPSNQSEPDEPDEPIAPKDPVIPDKPQQPDVPDEPEQPEKPYRYPCDVSAYLPAITTTYDNILLVNKTHPLGANYVPDDLVYLNEEDTMPGKLYRLDGTAAMALHAMLLCMRADGITDTYVTSAYRSYSDQKALQKKYVEDLQKDYPDLSKAEALEVVRKYSAEEGKSEHQSGLCVDFFVSSCMKELENYGYEGKYSDVGFAETPAFIWLQNNACQFGFILRYPKDKVNVTKYSYESWHYRFVGRDAAIAITEAGLTLEEYLAR